MKLKQLFENTNSQFLQTREEIDDLIKSRRVVLVDGSYEIHEDFSVSVDGNVTFIPLLNPQNNFPFRWRTVTGGFSCTRFGLTSLEGSPREVGGSFNVSSNSLYRLKGSPREVGKSFMCSRNKLTDLQGSPKFVGGDFDCSSNRDLTSSYGISKHIGGDVYFYETKVDPAEIMGDAEHVEGQFIGNEE